MDEAQVALSAELKKLQTVLPEPCAGCLGFICIGPGLFLALIFFAITFQAAAFIGDSVQRGHGNV